MPVYGMLRVRDEEHNLERCLNSILRVCDRVYVMDDHSTDKTAEIVQSYDGYRCKYFLSPFTPDDLNEARDKTWLLERICEDVPEYGYGPTSAHWVFQIDGDEELYEPDRYKFKSEHLGTRDHWCAQLIYLWNSPNAVRWDGHYAKCYRPTIFRLLRRGMEFRNHSGQLHPSGVPVSHISSDPNVVHEPEPIRILHYGYLSEEERARKYRWYLGHDPTQEPFYRKECFGPATLVPLSSVLR